MNRKTLWILGGSSLALGSGTIAYFLFFKDKSKKDELGNTIIPKRKSGGVQGGVKAATGNKGNTLTEPNWDKPFHMNYELAVKKWVAPRRIKVLPKEEAAAMAAALKKAKGGGLFRNDKEEVVSNIFRKKLKDKVQVSNLSKAFYHMPGNLDLWDYLDSFLSDYEMEKYVTKPVRALPDYRKA